MQSVRKCLERCFKRGGKEKDDGYDDATNRKGSVDDADSWGEWDDDIENQSNFAASRKRSGSGGASSANISKDSGMVGNSNTPLMYTSNVSATVRSSRPRNTSWMMKNKKKLLGVPTKIEMLDAEVIRLKDGKAKGGFRYLAVESEIKGKYSKWNSNNGYVNPSTCRPCEVAQAFR